MSFTDPSMYDALAYYDEDKQKKKKKSRRRHRGKKKKAAAAQAAPPAPAPVSASAAPTPKPVTVAPAPAPAPTRAPAPAPVPAPRAQPAASNHGGRDPIHVNLEKVANMSNVEEVISAFIKFLPLSEQNMRAFFDSKALQLLITSLLNKRPPIHVDSKLQHLFTLCLGAGEDNGGGAAHLVTHKLRRIIEALNESSTPQTRTPWPIGSRRRSPSRGHCYAVEKRWKRSC